MRDTDDLTFAHRPEIAAVERMGMRLHDEKLPFEKSETPLPDRERTSVLVSLEGFGDDLAIYENDSGGPADSIATDPSNALEKWDAARKECVSGEQRLERFGGSNDHDIATRRGAIFDAVPPNRGASGGVVDDPRNGGFGGQHNDSDQCN
jgi:hypothetical protein